MIEYLDDDLPLPSFDEVFGEPVRPKKKKVRVNTQTLSNASNFQLPLRSSMPSKALVDGVPGRWTEEEHRIFLEGIMLYGKDWKRIQPMIKTRSLLQIRTHAQKVFKLIGLKRIKARQISTADTIVGTSGDGGGGGDGTSVKSTGTSKKRGSLRAADQSSSAGTESHTHSDTQPQSFETNHSNSTVNAGIISYPESLLNHEESHYLHDIGIGDDEDDEDIGWDE